MDASKRWVPLLGAALLNLTLGSVYAWSVFVLPLEHDFGWTRARTSWVFTILMMTTTVCVVVAGRLQDRYGPRLGATVGVVSIGLAYLLASFTGALWYLYLTFGCLGGIGNGVGYATAVPVASKWFPEKRGLAVGLLVGAYGAGSAIIGPVASSLIEHDGWRLTFRMLGAVFLVLGLIGATLIRNPPAGSSSASRGPVRDSDTVELTPAEMMRLPTFYALWIAYWTGTTAGMMTISQIVPFARASGLTATAATLAVTVGAFGNTGGRVLSGWLSDAWGRLRTLRVVLVILAAAMPTLFAVRERGAMLYLLVAVVYWCYGTQLSVFAATTADFFGTRNLGSNYGALFTAVGFAGVIGPILGGYAFEQFGDYRYAFTAAGGLAVVALIALGFVARPVPAATLRAAAS